MGSDTSTAALVALLEHVPAAARDRESVLKERGAETLLERKLGLLAATAVADAELQIQAWRSRGWSVVSVFDDEYPLLLRNTAEAPVLLFVTGRLQAVDRRIVSVVGTRRPTPQGCSLAADLTRCLAAAGYTVVSGLAAGIDTVAHRTALTCGARTVGVLGNGLDHCYPPQNADLQGQRIERRGAVVSQFLPPTRPSRRSFPIRNAVMSGLTIATVIVEASPTSGTRVQARSALSQGRRVLLMPPVLANQWAVELAERPGVEILDSVQAVLEALEPAETRAA